MKAETPMFVHGTCRKFAEQISREGRLRSGFGEVWAAVASDAGREIAAFFAAEKAAAVGDGPALVYFRTDAIPDELRYMGETVSFFEWEHSWHVDTLPIEFVRWEGLD